MIDSVVCTNLLHQHKTSLPVAARFLFYAKPCG